jgi:SAM-dependent methyltransferase
MNAEAELVWTPEMVAQFWEHEGLHPERFFSFGHSRTLIRQFQRYLKPKKLRILDFGAGRGYLVDEVIPQHLCAAIEYSHAATDHLNDRFKSHGHFLGARCVDQAVPWPPGFDVAFLIEVIEHLYDAELDRTLSLLRDLIRPGGSLIVTTPNDEDRGAHLIPSPESGRLFHRWQHVRSWSRQSLSQLLASADFDPIEIAETNFDISIHTSARSRTLPYRIIRTAALQAALWSRKPPHLYAIARRRG